MPPKNTLPKEVPAHIAPLVIICFRTIAVRQLHKDIFTLIDIDIPQSDYFRNLLHTGIDLPAQKILAASKGSLNKVDLTFLKMIKNLSQKTYQVFEHMGQHEDRRQEIDIYFDRLTTFAATLIHSYTQSLASLPLLDTHTQKLDWIELHVLAEFIHDFIIPNHHDCATEMWTATPNVISTTAPEGLIRIGIECHFAPCPYDPPYRATHMYN